MLTAQRTGWLSAEAGFPARVCLAVQLRATPHAASTARHVTSRQLPDARQRPLQVHLMSTPAPDEHTVGGGVGGDEGGPLV